MGNLTSFIFHLQIWIVLPVSYIFPWDWKGLWDAGYCWDTCCAIICTIPSGPGPECLIFLLDSQKPFVRLWILQPRVLSPSCIMGPVFSRVVFPPQVLPRSKVWVPLLYKPIFIYNPGESLSSLPGALPCIMLLWGWFILLFYSNLNGLLNPKPLSLQPKLLFPLS